MKRRYWIFSIVALFVLLGATLGLEKQEVGDGRGNWTVVGRRLVPPWHPAPEAASLPDADAHTAVRVTWWYCYGIGFKHSQYHGTAK